MELIKPLIRHLQGVPRTELDEAEDDNVRHNASVYERTAEELKKMIQQGLNVTGTLASSVHRARTVIASQPHISHNNRRGNIRQSVNEALDQMERDRVAAHPIK